jgi:hypothetical protein
MKKLLITIVAVAISCVAFADTTPPAPATATMSGAIGPGGPGGSGNHPCKKIAEACKAAGYVRGGGKTGKGIMENCIQPIMSGQVVANVRVEPSDIAACKQRHSQNMPH